MGGRNRSKALPAVIRHHHRVGDRIDHPKVDLLLVGRIHRQDPWLGRRRERDGGRGPGHTTVGADQETGGPTREAWRRACAGLVLLLAAGAGLGDDVRTAPNERLGAREVQLDLPHLGTSAVHIPRTSPTGVVLLLHRGGTSTERSALVNAIPWHVLLVDVDTSRLDARAASIVPARRPSSRTSRVGPSATPASLVTCGRWSSARQGP